MNNKLVVGGGLIGAALFGGYLLKMNRLNNELETVTAVNIHKMTLTGLELRVDVTLKNPSGGSVKVKYPFVKMQYGSTTFATSEARNEDFVLPKFSQLQMPPLFVNVSLSTLAGSIPAALAELRKNGKVDITVKTVSTLNNTMPYSRVDVLSLSNPLNKEA